MKMATMIKTTTTTASHNSIIPFAGMETFTFRTVPVSFPGHPGNVTIQ